MDCSRCRYPYVHTWTLNGVIQFQGTVCQKDGICWAVGVTQATVWTTSPAAPSQAVSGPQASSEQDLDGYFERRVVPVLAYDGAGEPFRITDIDVGEGEDLGLPRGESHREEATDPLGEDILPLALSD